MLIRPFTLADTDAAHALYSDPQVMRYVPGGPRTRDGSLARLQEHVEHQRRHGFSKWAVFRNADRTFVGDCGLQYLADGPDIELGFHMLPAHWGRGYATEAASACLGWGLRERSERVVAIVDPANRTSIRVLEKIGMRSAGKASYFDQEWLLYVIEPQTAEPSSS